MIRRDRSRAHAAPTARARRVRAAADRAEQLRARGIDPTDYERATASAWGPPAAQRSESPPPVEARPAPAPAPRRPLRIKRFVITAVVLLLVIVVAGSALLYQRVDAFNRAVSSTPTLSSSLFGPLGGKDRVNVLMVGYSGDPGHGGTYLADSLNILSIDPVAKATTLIAIPRDLWIQGLSQMPKGGKVNEAFALGWDKGSWQRAGPVQAAVLSEVTGLKIDHWISIDFAGFSLMVDSVGGVTIDNPTAFKYTWSEQNFSNHFWDGGSFATGTLHLTGTRALDYARTRYTSVVAESSDFARSVRQQRVLAALRDQIGSGFGSLGAGLAMMDVAKGHLHTDLSAIDLFLLSGHMHTDRRLELTEGVALQAGRNNAGSYILFPVGAKKLGDYAPLRRFLATELAKPIAAPTPSAAATPTD